MNSSDIVVTFGSGILGAAAGALAVFEFVGPLVTAMAVVQVITGTSSDFITFPFGLFGSYTGDFAAGVAATTYAAKRGKLDSGRDTTAGLSGLAVYDMLLVGGIFGVVGYIIAQELNQTLAFPFSNAWTDTATLAVVISDMVSRLVFGKTGLFGKPEQGICHCYSPQDKCRIPYHSHIPQLSVLGLSVGSMAGFLGLEPDGSGALLAFGTSTFSSIFLCFNTQVPVSRHILLPVALVAVPSSSLAWAATVSIICAILGELVSRILLVHGDAHIDPPAMVITIMTAMVSLLTTIGLLTLIPLFQPRHDEKPAVSAYWLFVMCTVTDAVLQLQWRKNG